MAPPIIIPMTIACLVSAAQHQHIPPAVMWGLWSVEQGWPGASVRNRDGSHDLGSLQINDSTWLPLIARLQFNGDMEKARIRVQYDGCYNAQVGAWIFAQELSKAQGNLGLAIGHYHSHTPELAASYTAMFLAHVKKLYAAPARQQKQAQNIKPEYKKPEAIQPPVILTTSINIPSGVKP